MLGEADVGFLIHAPQNVIDEFPQFKPVNTLQELKAAFVGASNRNLSL
jgi:phosphoserine/homoserine phosphotransferase